MESGKKTEIHIRQTPLYQNNKEEKYSMTANFYGTKTYDPEHIHFGGIIYPSDFYTNLKQEAKKGGSSIASRIEADLRRGECLIRERMRSETL